MHMCVNRGHLGSKVERCHFGLRAVSLIGKAKSPRCPCFRRVRRCSFSEGNKKAQFPILVHIYIKPSNSVLTDLHCGNYVLHIIYSKVFWLTCSLACLMFTFSTFIHVLNVLCAVYVFISTCVISHKINLCSNVGHEVSHFRCAILAIFHIIIYCSHDITLVRYEMQIIFS